MELSFHCLEFEQEVRKQLNILDRPITEEDTQRVTDLSLSEFTFENDDLETLLCFRNLKELDIETRCEDTDFWKQFIHMECLNWTTLGYDVDFRVFSNMQNLTALSVSGGDYSNIQLRHLDALIPLRKLEDLCLHEFGSVDLAPLEAMKQIKYLRVLYSYGVVNAEAIGSMTQLKWLNLAGLVVNNLDFLDTLPDDLEIEMSGIEILDWQNVDVRKWKRFRNRDISEMYVRKEYQEGLSLSALDE